jgi:hypothetical protein
MTITINLKGRLGNQLFQYAALRNISIKKNYDLYINTNIEWHGQYNILQYFNIKNSNPPDQIQYRYNQPNGSYFFDTSIYNIQDNTLVDGHFENVNYFNDNIDIIKNELTIKDETINNSTDSYINSISKNGSKVIGIQFRRGDLIQQLSETEDEFNDKNIKYIHESLETILKNENKIVLLIFTGGIRKAGYDQNWKHHTHEDDINWVKKFINDNNNYDIHLSPGTIDNDELIDFSLMTKCDYLITPHQSTFSFMAYCMSNICKNIMSPTNLYGKLDK